MTTPKEMDKDMILGIVAPVIIANLELDVLVETNMEFMHQARKVYALETQVTLDCFAGEGLVLFQGRIIEDVYYVELVDSIVRCQVLDKAFNGFRKNSRIKKGMLCRGTACIQKENIFNEIIDGSQLRQKLIVDVKINVLREETIPRSLVVTGPIEHPIYQVGNTASQRELEQICGTETRSEYPDMALDDPNAVLSPGWPKNIKL